MTSMTSLARALTPAAILVAAPAAAADSPDLARLKAHLTSVQTMTANFTQTDAAIYTLVAQAGSYVVITTLGLIGLWQYRVSRVETQVIRPVIDSDGRSKRIESLT